MKKVKSIFALATLFIALGCSTNIRTTLTDKSLAALSADANVTVIAVNEQPPAGKVLGRVKVGDSGFTTDCGYNTVVDQAKAEARKAGGNALKLTKVKEPTALGSSCYRIEADILSVPDIAGFVQKTKIVQDSITKTKFPPNPDYALLYVYRRNSLNGVLLNYTIHLEGVPLFKVHNDTKKVVKITKEGLQKVRASLETEEIKEIDVKFGEEYFLECSINSGVFIGRPELNFVDKAIGRAQYDKITQVLE